MHPSDSSADTPYSWDDSHALVGRKYLQYHRLEGGTFTTDHPDTPLGGLGSYARPRVGVVLAVDEQNRKVQVEFREIIYESGFPTNGNLDGHWEVVPFNLAAACIMLGEIASTHKQAGPAAAEPSSEFNLEAPAGFTSADVNKWMSASLLQIEPRPGLGQKLPSSEQRTLNKAVEDLSKLCLASEQVKERKDFGAQIEILRDMIAAQPLLTDGPFESRGGDVVLISNSSDPADPACKTFVWHFAVIMHHAVDCVDADDNKSNGRDPNSEIPVHAYKTDLLCAPRLLYIGPLSAERTFYSARCQLSWDRYVSPNKKGVLLPPHGWYKWCIVSLPHGTLIPPPAAEETAPKRQRGSSSTAPPAMGKQLRDMTFKTWLENFILTSGGEKHSLGAPSQYSAVPYEQLKQLCDSTSADFVKFCLTADSGYVWEGEDPFDWEFGRFRVWRLLVPNGPLNEWLDGLIKAGVLSADDRNATSAHYLVMLEPFFLKPGAAGPSKRDPVARLSDHRATGWLVVLCFWGRREREHRDVQWAAELRWQRLLTSTNAVPTRVRKGMWGSGSPIGHLNELRRGNSSIGYSAREAISMHAPHDPKRFTRVAERIAKTCMTAMAEQASLDSGATNETTPCDLVQRLREMDDHE